jgi:aerobic carbon-monoxide dehydrogenase medium subunit
MRRIRVWVRHQCGENAWPESDWRSRQMKPPRFDYVAPDDFDAAVDQLAADGDARILAGGQSLVPMLSFRFAQPTTLIDLSRLPGVNRIELRAGEIELGSMVTQAQALDSPEVAAACPLACDALRHMGHPQIRSRGTVVGSIAHADPAAELPAALLALAGVITARGPNGIRSIAAADLFRGMYATALEPDEIATHVRFPVAPPRSGAACVELAPRLGDFATAGVTCQLSRAADGSVADARVALFAVADRPIRLQAVEDALNGAEPGSETWRRAAQLAMDGWTDRASGSGDGRYRTRVVPVIVRRALASAWERSS